MRNVLFLDLLVGLALDGVPRHALRLHLFGDRAGALGVENVLLGPHRLQRGLVQAGDGDRFQRQAVGLEVFGHDLLHGLGEFGPLGVQGVQRLRGGHRPQRRDQFLLDQVLHAAGVAQDGPQRGRRLLDRLFLFLHADVKHGLHVGAEKIGRDQGVRAGAVDLQLEGPQRDGDDLVDDGDHDRAAVDDAPPPAHARADEGLVGRGLVVEPRDDHEDAEEQGHRRAEAGQRHLRAGVNRRNEERAHDHRHSHEEAHDKKSRH